MQMKDTKGATERKQQVNYKQQQKILQVVTDRCSFFIPHSSKIFLSQIINARLAGWSCCMMLQAASLVMVSPGCHVCLSDELALIYAENIAHTQVQI